MANIKMRYPKGEENRLFDGKEHEISVSSLKRIEYTDFYVMYYYDKTHNCSCRTIIQIRNNVATKIPLTDYHLFNIVVNRYRLTDVDIDILPNQIGTLNPINIRELENIIRDDLAKGPRVASSGPKPSLAKFSSVGPVPPAEPKFANASPVPPDDNPTHKITERNVKVFAVPLYEDGKLIGLELYSYNKRGLKLGTKEMIFTETESVHTTSYNGPLINLLFKKKPAVVLVNYTKKNGDIEKVYYVIDSLVLNFHMEHDRSNLNIVASEYYLHQKDKGYIYYNASEEYKIESGHSRK